MNLTREWRQAILSILLVSNLLASAASSFNARYLIVCIVSFVILLFTYECVMKLWAKQTTRSAFGQSYARIRLELNALSLPEAKRRATELLRNPAIFETKEAHSPDASLLTNLGPTLHEFFLTFDSVRAVKGEFFVGIEWVARSHDPQHLIKLGIDIAGAEYVVAQDSDEIIERDEADSASTTHKSIYHLILLSAWTLSPSMVEGKL